MKLFLFVFWLADFCFATTVNKVVTIAAVPQSIVVNAVVTTPLRLGIIEDNQDINGTNVYSVDVQLSNGGEIWAPIFGIGSGGFSVSNWRKLDTTPYRTAPSLSGSRELINKLLGSMKFRCPVSCDINVTLMQNQATVGRYRIPVTAVPIVREDTGSVQVIVPVKVPHIAEDSSYTLRGLSVASQDVTSSYTYELILSADRGFVELSDAHDVMDIRLQSYGSLLQLQTNSLTSLNRALQGIIYTPPNDFSGAVQLTASVVMQPLHDSNNVLSSYACKRGFYLFVDAVDDAPVIVLRSPCPWIMGGRVTSLHQEISLSCFGILDVDGSPAPLLVEVSTDHGMLRIDDVHCSAKSLVAHDPSLDARSDNSVAFLTHSTDAMDAIGCILLKITEAGIYKSRISVAVTSFAAAVSTGGGAPGWTSPPVSVTSIVTRTEEVGVEIPRALMLDCAENVVLHEGDMLDIGSICSFSLPHQTANATELFMLSIACDSGGQLVVPSSTATDIAAAWSIDDYTVDLTVSLGDIATALHRVKYIGSGINTHAAQLSIRGEAMVGDVWAKELVSIMVLPKNMYPSIVVADGVSEPLATSASMSLPLNFISFVGSFGMLLDEEPWFTLSVKADIGTIQCAVGLRVEDATQSESLLLEKCVGDIIVHGTLAELTSLLHMKGLEYLPSAGIDKDALRITLIDTMNISKMPAPLTKTIELLIPTPQPKATFKSNHEVIYITEYESYSFTSDDVTLDIDNLDDSMICYLTVSVPIGIVAVDPSLSRSGYTLSTTTSLSGQHTIHITGTALVLQQVLRAVHFAPQAQFFGDASVDFFIRFGAETASLSLLMHIYAVNDPPVIHSYPPSRRPRLLQGHSLALRDIGVHVSDPDIVASDSSAEVSVALDVECGAFVLSMTAFVALRHSDLVQLATANSITANSLNGCHRSGNFTNDGVSWGYGHVSVSGPLADVNAILAAIEYHSPSTQVNDVELKIVVCDKGNVGLGGPISVSEDIIVAVEVAETAKSLKSTPEIFVDEGVAALTVIDKFALQFPMGDIRSRFSFSISARSFSKHPDYPQSDFHTIAINDGSGVYHNGSLRIVDSLGAIALRVSSMSVIWHDHYHGVSIVDFNLESVEDAANENIDLTTATRVVVNALNSAPRIIVDTTASFQEDVPGCLPFTVMDVDVSVLSHSAVAYETKAVFDAMTRFYINLRCSKCFFVNNAGTIASGFNISGPLEKVNYELSAWRVQSDKDYSGNMTISVVADDLGTYGKGSSMVIQSDVVVLASPVNDAPVVNIPSILEVDEGKLVKVFSTEVDPIIDVDFTTHEVFRVSLSCDFGRLLVLGNLSESVAVISRDDNAIEFESTLFWANLTMRQIGYQAMDNIRVRDTISVAVMDGNFDSVEAAVQVVIGTFNAPSAIELIGIASILDSPEDTIFHFPPIDIADSDTAYVGSEIQAGVRVSHSCVLEVQQVKTETQHIDEIQVIELISENSFFDVNITFTLTMAPTCGGAGSRFVSNEIFAGALASRDDERRGSEPGANVGESMESIVENMLESCDIDVSVAREDVLINVSHSARLWHVTFHNVSFTFPLLSVSNLTSESLSITSYTSRGANSIGGTFSLIFGSDETKKIPHNASAEQLAAALMDLPSIDALSVTRSSAGLEDGFAWLVTFFAVSFPHNSYHARLPLLKGNSSTLTGDWVVQAPQKNPLLIEANVVTERLRLGNGIPRVATVTSTANHVEEVIEVVYTFTGSDIAASHPEFYIKLVDVDSNVANDVGPLFAATVAMRRDEQVGLYPPHSQVAGTKRHESFQHLLESAPIFADLASAVTVTKYETVTDPSDTVTRVSWLVTFHQASGANFRLVPTQNKFSKGNATIRRIRHPNAIGGKFTLAYGRYTTTPLPYDATAAMVESALMHLPSIQDPETLIGAVQVGRRGPTAEKGYIWFVAFVQDAEIPYDLAVGRNMDSQVQLTGMGARLGVQSQGTRLHGGLQLSRGVNGIRNIGDTSLFEVSDTISFAGQTSTIAAALSRIQYVPQPDWNGAVTFIIRLSDGVSTESMSVNSFTINVIQVNDAPAIMWHAAPLTNNSELIVYEDADVLIGGEYVLSLSDNALAGGMSGTDIHRNNTRLGLQVFDCDAADVPIMVKVVASYGYLHLDSALLTVGRSTPVILNGVTRHRMPAYLTEGTLGSELEISGDVFAVNDVLNTLKYQSILNFNGYDTISLVVSDGDNVVQSDLRVKVLAVNDAPVIDVLGTQRGVLYDNESSWQVGIFETEEDTEFPIGSKFVIFDADMEPEKYNPPLFGKFRDLSFATEHRLENFMFEVGVAVSNGVLYVPEQLGVVAEYSKKRTDANFGASSGFAKVRLVGKYSAVREVVSQMTYIPDKHWYGHDMCEVYVNDMGNGGKGGHRHLTRRFVISVFSAVDSPVIILPAAHALHTMEDSAGLIGSGEDGEVLEALANAAGIRREEIISISATSLRILDSDMRQQLRDTRFIIRSSNNTSRNPLSNDPLFNHTFASPASVDVEQFFMSATIGAPNYAGILTPAESSVVQVELKVSHGTISLHRINHDIEMLHGSGLHDSVLVLRGPLHAMNIALEAVIYVPDLNWNSRRNAIDAMVRGISTTERLYVNVSDPQGQSNAAYIDMIVEAANDPPVIGMGKQILHDFIDGVADQQSKNRIHSNVLRCVEDALCPLLQLWVRDVDAADNINGALKVSFSANNGSFAFDPLYISFPHLATASYSSDDDNFYEVTVPTSDLSLSLQGISYLPHTNFFGRDTIVITANDMGNTGWGRLCEQSSQNICALTDTLLVPVLVEGKPDTPLIVVPVRTMEVHEDESVVLAGVYLVDKDRSMSAGIDKLIFVSLTAADGKLLLSEVPVGVDMAVGSAGKMYSHIAFTGNGDIINACLRSIVFYPTANFNSEHFGRLANIHIVATDILHQSDFGVAASAHFDVYFRVLPSNDYPMVILPGVTERPEAVVLANDKPRSVDRVETVLLDEDSSYELSSVRFYDVDFDVTDSSTLSLWTVTFSCEHCFFDTRNYTVRRLMSLPKEKSECTIQGRSIVQLNAITSHIIYSPFRNYNGDDQLTIRICDNGLPVLCDERSLPVRIRAVNDAPVWTVPNYPVILRENTALLLGGLVLVDDIDAGDDDIIIDIEIDHGTITFPTLPHSLSFRNGTGEADSRVSISGPLFAMQQALSLAVYTPPLHWNSVKSGMADIMHFVVNDTGHSSYLNSEVAEQRNSLLAVDNMLIVVSEQYTQPPFINLPGATVREFPCESREGRVGAAEPNHHAPKHIMCRTIVSVASISVAEDTITAISGISLENSDVGPFNNAGIMEVIVTVLHGQLLLPSAKALGVDAREVIGASAGSVSVVGQLAQLNRCLLDLQYKPAPDYYGPDYLSIHATDRGYVGYNGQLSTNETIPLIVYDVPDAPTLEIPSKFEFIAEDHRLIIADVRISDSDFVEMIAGRPTFSRNQDYEDTFSWNVSQDLIQESKMLRVQIKANHGSIMLLTFNRLQIIDIPTVNEESSRLAELPIAGTAELRKRYAGATHNSSIPTVAAGSFSSTYAWWKKVTFEGRLHDINIALRTITYQPDTNWNSEIDDEFDILTLTVTDLVNSASIPDVIDCIKINVLPVQDAPVITMPGEIRDAKRLSKDLLSSAVVDVNALFIQEDESITIRGITVRSVDAILRESDDFVRIKISACHGKVRLPKAEKSHLLAGIIVEQGSLVNGSDALAFRAPLSLVNTALAEVQFQPLKNYFGTSACVRITASNVAAQGLQLQSLDENSDERYVRIIVSPKNDPPEIVIPADTGGLEIFSLNGGSFIRIEGARNWNSNGQLATNPRGQSGYELWRLKETTRPFDRSEFGLGSLEWSFRQASDINPGFGSSHPKYLVTYKNFLYFQADDGVHGEELWREAAGQLPGTPADDTSFYGSSASLFADLNPGRQPSSPSYLTLHNDVLYFSANGIDTSWMLDEGRVDECNGFRQNTFDNRVFYGVSENNRWDPQRTYECPLGYHWATTAEAQRLMTVPYDHDHDHMWHSLGYSEIGLPIGKQKFRDAGEFETATSVGHENEPNAYLNQCGWDGYYWGGVRRTHFLFADSIVTKAYKHAGRGDSIRPTIDRAQSLEQLQEGDFAGIICIAGDYDTACRSGQECRQGAGQELWRSDGTYEGTWRVADIVPGSTGSHPCFLTSFGQYLYFSAQMLNGGRELYRSNGEIGSAQLVSLASSGLRPGADSSDPTHMVVAENKLFFAATTHDFGRELWMANLPGEGGLEWFDLVRGKGSSSPDELQSSGGNLPLFFAATDPTHGREIWVSDGTREGTSIVKDINKGVRGSNPKYLTWFKDKMYFQAEDAAHGRELWCTDGTAAGTRMLVDIRWGRPSSAPSHLTVMTFRHNNADYLLFTASDGQYVNGAENADGYEGSQLWRTDGTKSGTERLFQNTGNDFYFDHRALDAAYPSSMGTLGSELFVPANRGTAFLKQPFGGFDVANEEAVQGINQALVISDVDTPFAADVSVTMSVTNGFIVLPTIPRYTSSEFPIHGNTTFLVVDDEVTNRILLANALQSYGTVMTARTGKEAYDMTVAANGTIDCILMDVRMPMGWDGLQATRMLRLWEQQIRDGEVSGKMPRQEGVIIFGTGATNSLQFDTVEALGAGMNAFFQRPFKDYVGPELDLVGFDSVEQRSFRTLDSLQDEQESLEYDTFVQSVLSYIEKERTERDMVQVTTTVAENITMPTNEVLATLPGKIIGSSITIRGTLVHVNIVLRSVYFFAPDGTSGDVYFSVSATDTPLACNADGVSIDKPIPSLSSFENIEATLCDRGGRSATGSSLVRIVIIGRNRPPEILLESTESFVAELDTPIAMAGVSVFDSDFETAAALQTDTFGIIRKPPVTVYIDAQLGAVDFPLRDNVAIFVESIGERKRNVVFGPIDAVNAILAEMVYTCFLRDGCFAGQEDAVTVVVDDGGFVGFGGALQAAITIHVKIIP